MVWRILGAAVVIAVLALLVLAYGNAREQQGRLAERVASRDQQLTDARAAADQRATADARANAAVATYADRAAALKPIILTSHDTVTEYAQTPAGAAPCLGADRVRGIDELDATLFSGQPPASAGGSADAVHADPGAPPAGR